MHNEVNFAFYAIPTVTGVTTTTSIKADMSVTHLLPSDEDERHFRPAPLLPRGGDIGVDLGLCPAGIKTMEDFDMERVSESDLTSNLSIKYLEFNNSSLND